jgi:hypothetical protein
MDRYESSLARACLVFSGLNCLYEYSVPQDFEIPSLYFPPTEIQPSQSTLNGYSSEYTIYAKVFALTTRDAVSLAEKVVQGIMLKKCTIPIYLENGNESGELMKLEPPEARESDEGVAQLILRYRVARRFTAEKQTASKSIGINKNYK